MFSLKEIAKITKAEFSGISGDLIVTGVSTDTRTIKKGELFVTLKGENFDGADFIEDAVKKGALAVLLESGKGVSAGIPAIRVESTNRALSDLARYHRKRFDMPVIGITGSNGKTTIKDMIAHILSKKFNVLKTNENYNNKVGVAGILLKLKDEDIAVVEVGTNSIGEVAYNADVLKPTIGLITNIGPSHLEGLRDRKGVFKEKIALVESLDKGAMWIKNIDDEMLRPCEYENLNILSYAIHQDADFKAEDIVECNDGIKFRLDKKRIEVPLLGIHNVYNTLASIATCSIFMDIDSIIAMLKTFKGVPMRMEIMDGGGFTIINDCYNSNPLSFKCAISSLKSYSCKGKKIIVCADMLELGKDSKVLHYNSGRALAEMGALDYLVTFGERAKEINRGALEGGMEEKNLRHFDRKEDIEPFLRTIITEGDTVLVKGSRGMEMEDIINCFTTCSTH